MEDRSCHTVPALAPVELCENATAVRLVVQVVQQVQRLGHAAHFANRPAQRRGAAAALKATDQLQGTDGPGMRVATEQNRQFGAHQCLT